MQSSFFNDLDGIIEFEYLEPKTTKEACAWLNQYQENAKIIAGGTKLMASMRQRKITPRYLINLKSILNLEFITADEEGLRIGALTTLYAISQSSIANDKAKILVEAIQQREPGVNQARWAYYMATMGGHLSHPASSVDIAPPLIILGAKAVVEGLKGWKTIPLEDLFDQNGEAAFQKDEVLTEIRIPKLSADIGLVYMKSGGSSGAPTFNTAVSLQLDGKHVNVEELRIVVGGVTPKIMEAREAVGFMKDKPIDNDLIEETARAAAKEVGGRSDAEAEGRAQELIEEAIRQAVDRAIGEFALGY
ncbi:MAG: FAD binding domain-containing protein [Syntrophaceae bacterium]|nr:FAD binding domain-containing protein [Syntrophaceae bacterium]